jgi:acetyl esterase/lipase
MSVLIRIITSSIGILSALVSVCNYLHIRSQKWAYLILPKMIANSLAACIAMVCLLCVILGGFYKAPLAVVSGLTGALISIRYIARVIASQADFEKAFGTEWVEIIPPEQRRRLTQKRWVLWPARSPEARWERDLPFWTIPGSDRRLLCDLWQPPNRVPSSGLAVIYLHSGEWHFADKNFGTPPLFRHIAGQGHVVMDVAYRLCPEVDLFGMLGDVQRAVAWMKTNAAQYGVDPNRIILAGGSAGGHLALLAAYTSNRLERIPDKTQVDDFRVRGVVSYYGPTDLRAFFEGGYGKVNPPKKVKEISGNMLGCSSAQRQVLYQKGSPTTYIMPDCPPTLIFQGEHDSGVPVSSARDFYLELVNAGVRAVYVEFPQTDHAFDLQIKGIAAIMRKNLHLPPSKNNLEDISQYSPAAQAALYDLDRFLALMASNARQEPDNKFSPKSTSSVSSAPFP